MRLAAAASEETDRVHTFINEKSTRRVLILLGGISVYDLSRVVT